MYDIEGRTHKESIRGNNTKSKVIPKEYESLNHNLESIFVDTNGALKIPKSIFLCSKAKICWAKKPLSMPKA